MAQEMALATVKMEKSEENTKFLNAKYKQEFQRTASSANSLQFNISALTVGFFNDVIDFNVNYQLFNEFYQSLGRGVNKLALKEWVEAHTPLRFNKETQAFIRSKKRKWDKELINSALSYFEFIKEKKEIVQTWDASKKEAAIKKAMEKLIAEFHTHNKDASKYETILALL